MIWKRERDAEHEDARNRIENRCFRTLILKVVSIRIVRRPNCDSYMNRFLRAPLLFFLFSKAVQHGLAPFVACSRGRGLSGFVTSRTREVTRCSPYELFLLALNCQNFKRRYLRLHWTVSAATLQILFMLKQQHYTVTNFKKVKSQSTTPLIYLKENSIKAIYIPVLL